MGTLGLIIAGLFGLVLGGEMLLRGAVSVAKAWGVPPLVIGLTLVGFGTSTPELVASLQAAFAGSPGIAVGNVVGSNIGNILLILGLATLLAPIAVTPNALYRDGAVMTGAAALCLAAVLMGTVGRGMGAVLVLSLIAYLVYTLVTERRGSGTAAAHVYEAEAEAVPGRDHGVAVSLILSLAGLALTVLGARFLVTGAIDLAAAAGVSEAVIGLTVVAIGTSLPELVTSVIAVRRGQGDVALGNIIGSNIFNVLGILGITAMVSPLSVPAEIRDFDIWVMCAATLALVLFARTGWRLARREGAVMLAAYGAYLGWLLV